MPVGTVQLVTQAQYARMRGCTEGAVRRAARDGRILLVEGKVDPVAADAQWQRNTRPRHGSRPATEEQRPADSPAPRESDSSGDYWTHKARREAAEAELAELKLAEQRGDLVRAADIRAAHGKRLAGLREALLQIPARLAAVLAAETEQARCHDALQAEINAVLSSVSEVA